MRAPARVLLVAAIAILAVPAFAADGTAVAPALSAHMERDIMPQVADLRGLAYMREVPVRMVTTADVAKYIERALDEDASPGEWEGSQRILAYLGLIPRGMDLRETLISVYSRQVAGYYDDETGAFFIVETSGMAGMDDITISHELVHALQDQAFDLSRYDDCIRDNDDMALAVMALAEGDASDIMLRYATDSQPRGMGPVPDYTSFMMLSLGPGALPDAPLVIAQNIVFPYTYGTRFVAAVLKEAGPDAVNRAFEDPPVSTEQIMNPDRYLTRDEPSIIELPDFAGKLPTGWRRVYAEPFGQFNLGLYLAAHTGTWEVEKAVEGWDGDVMAAYAGPLEDDTFVVHCSTWDSPQDAVEYAERYARLIEMRFPAAKRASCDVNGVCWVLDGKTFYVRRAGADVLVVENVPSAMAATAIIESWKAQKIPFGVAKPLICRPAADRRRAGPSQGGGGERSGESNMPQQRVY
jgi:hypothetical protein